MSLLCCSSCFGLARFYWGLVILLIVVRGDEVPALQWINGGGLGLGSGCGSGLGRGGLGRGRLGGDRCGGFCGRGRLACSGCLLVDLHIFIVVLIVVLIVVFIVVLVVVIILVAAHQCLGLGSNLGDAGSWLGTGLTGSVGSLGALELFNASFRVKEAGLVVLDLF